MSDTRTLYKVDNGFCASFGEFEPEAMAKSLKLWVRSSAAPATV